jgi:hypothetical protein
MMRRLSEDAIISRTIEWLSNHGYRSIKSKTTDEHGVDIRANTSYGRFVYIECKGDSDASSQREVNFVYALGQIVTRMSRSKFQSYGLAFPKSYESKLKRIPWQFAKRNNVFVLLVEPDGKIEKRTWKDLKKRGG